MAKKQQKKNAHPIKRYETPDYTDPRQLEAMIRRTFRERIEHTRKIERTHDGAPILADMEPVRVKRRSAALAQFMPRIRELAQPVCPDIDGLFSIEEDWAFVNALPFPSYDEQEDDLNLILGAAIWMLDHIKQNGRIRDAAALLPRDDDSLQEVNMVTMYDPVHSEDVIMGMVCAIENRNADCELPGQKRAQRKAQEREVNRRTLSDLATAMQVQHQDVPSRRRFEALLEMIPQKDIQQAVTNYEEKLFELVTLYFRCRATFSPGEMAAADKLNRFYENMSKRAVDMLGREKKKRSLSVLQQPAPMQMISPRTPSFSSSILEEMTTDPRELFQWFETEEKQLQNELDRIRFDVARTALLFHRLISLPRGTVEQDYSAEIADIVSSFQPGDPYEMCFALLYLLDTDSELPWLYLPGSAINTCAGAMLPWYYVDFEDLDDWRWQQYYGSEPEAGPPSVSQPPELTDWYQLNYQNRSSDPEDMFRVNLAQVFYEATGCIPPRDLHRYDDALRLMKHYGITGKKVQIPMLYAMAAAGESKYQSHVPYAGESMIEKLLPALMERVQADAKPMLQEKMTYESQQEELDALKAENERLKRMAYGADRETRTLRREYETLLQTSQREHQEVAELREILFHQENQQEPELDEAEEAVALPYTVRHTTVVFGGHDSWSRAIKPMLAGDIRFVDRDMLPEASLIRHADMVWLQPNSISHAFFYKIIKNIRTYHIPFHYFKFASAEKCARQLAGVDESRK